MNVDYSDINGLPKTTYEIQVQDIINQQMHNYATLMVILSGVILVYILWNNFVRSPSKPKETKEVFNPEAQIKTLIDEDVGIEPSIRVKKISRALDEYLIIPALVMFYISVSYYLAIR